MVEKRFLIVSAAEDDPIYREGWSVSIPSKLSRGSGMRSVDMPKPPSPLTPEQQKLSALEQTALLHQANQNKR